MYSLRMWHGNESLVVAGANGSAETVRPARLGGRSSRPARAIVWFRPTTSMMERAGVLTLSIGYVVV